MPEYYHVLYDLTSGDIYAAGRAVDELIEDEDMENVGIATVRRSDRNPLTMNIRDCQLYVKGTDHA